MSESNNSSWILEAFSAARQGLGLSSSIFRKADYELVLTDMDEVRLSRLVQPLPLSSPSKVGKQIEEAGGIQALFSPAAKAAIAVWGTRHRAVQILRELSKTVSVLLRAYQQGQLNNAAAILRTLPVIAMSAFTPGK